MMSPVAAALGWLAGRRWRELDRVWRDPVGAQERALARMVRRARHTWWGRAHGFADIRSVDGYQRRVPVATYGTLRPLIARILAGEQDVLWPGHPGEFCKTSGTTDGDKLIPLTPDARRSQRRGGLDALLFAVHRVGHARLLDGPMLFLGGSTHTESVGAGLRVGDLSGLMAGRLPAWIRHRYAPGPEIAAIPDWEARIEATAAAACRQDLRLISGMPSWMLVLFERVRRRLPDPERPLGWLWPRLEVFIHGGVRMTPYRSIVDAAIGRPLHFLEVYPASEGFVAVQAHATDPGLTLLLDHGLFYEFIPVAALARDDPPRLTVGKIRVGETYAICLTTPAGLWSYLLGDTVRVVSLDPPQIVITGRTQHFVNAFGENVIVEEVEHAIARACRQLGAELVEFTVAPAYPDGRAARARHEWAIEFRRAPASLAAFGRVLDASLQAMNTDYRTKRTGEVGMAAPLISVLPEGTFHGWLAAQGRLGDQHKVPRAANHRDVVDGVLEIARLATRRRPAPATPVAPA